MNKEKDFKILKSELAYNHYLKVRRDIVQLPNNETVDYNYIEPGDTVIILPILNGKIVMLKQYRYPLRKYIYDLPSGGVNSGETYKQAAIKELKEETGYTTNNIQHVHSFYYAPGCMGVTVHAFVAKNLTKGNQALEYSEFCEVKEVTISQFEKIILTETVEATIPATYYMAKQKLLI